MLYRGLVSGLSTHAISGSDRAADETERTGNPAVASMATGIRAGREGGIPPGPARWLADRLRRQQLHSLQRIVRGLDDALNNTSLILLFNVGRRRLLFPGDAQIENWRYTLDRLRKERPLRRRLSEIDLYKVGHHGSRNATPRSLVELWDGSRPLAALLSTCPGVHGKTEATAVPRATLVAALKERAELYSTEELEEGELLAVEADAKGREPFESQRSVPSPRVLAPTVFKGPGGRATAREATTESGARP